MKRKNKKIKFLSKKIKRDLIDFILDSGKLLVSYLILFIFVMGIIYFIKYI